MKKIQTDKIELFLRKYIVDICIAAVFIFLAVVLAEKPVTHYETGKRGNGETEKPQKTALSVPPLSPAHRFTDSPIPSLHDPSDFTADEFRIQGKDVRKLCEAIKDDHYKLGAISAPPDSVEWLNAVLLVGALFDKITEEKPDLALTAWIRKLKEQTEENRQKVFSSLKDDDRENIKKLNRLTLELAYAKEAPKDRNPAVRNIFEPEGNYAAPPELIIIPEKPYNLIAVLEGKEKKAIMREYTGRMVSFKIGDKMIDGTVVSGMDRLSVTAKKGKKTKEYRIFEVKKGIKR